MTKMEGDFSVVILGKLNMDKFLFFVNNNYHYQ